MWVLAFGVKEVQEDAPQWQTLVGWVAVFAVPTVLLLWLVQRTAQYRIPWLAELIGMPFAIGGIINVAIAIREIVRHST
jgi:hypothetical protein